MNMVAILPQLVMKVLQTQNVKRNTMATVQQAAPLLAAEPLLAAAHVSAAHVSAAHVSAAHVSAAHVSAAHVQQAPTTTYIEPIQDTLIETMTPLPLAAPFNGENTFLETTKV
jgi:hypothetical protein